MWFNPEDVVRRKIGELIKSGEISGGDVEKAKTGKEKAEKERQKGVKEAFTEALEKREYKRIDPITLRTIHNSLESITREMSTTMIRTAYSVIFVDGHDFSDAILDEWAEMVAVSNDNPVHLASMPYSAHQCVIEIGFENIEPGDVFINNDPYRGGTHITDMVVVKPIFHGKELVGFAGNRAHWLDIGGMAPSGFPGDAVEIFQEGLRIPPVKWFEGGRERTDIFDIIMSNVRSPWIQKGDFRAQLASDITAERRVQKLCDKYGVETVKEAIRAIKDYSEKRMRSEIEAIPDGKYEYEDFVDDDGITSDPYRIKVSLTVKGDSLTVDYTGTSRQSKGPANAVYGVTASSTFNALFFCSDPTIPVNWGAFRPVDIICPRGTLLNPLYPAPCFGGNTETSIRTIECIIGALAPVIPERALAASYGTCNVISVGGYDPDRKTRFVFLWYPEGGWGALKGKDGWDEIFNQIGNDADTPVEITEYELPFLYERCELTDDWEGAGQWRGGYGAVRQFRVLADEIIFSALGERHKFGPYGLFGGLPAKPNRILINRAENMEWDWRRSDRWKDAVEEWGVPSPSKFSIRPPMLRTLRKGDAWANVTSCGGGYGSPWKRDPQMVLEDVEDGLVSVERAADVYGVVIVKKGEDYVIDAEETEKLRAELSKKTIPPDQVIKGVITVCENSARWRKTFAARKEEIQEDPTADIIRRVVNEVASFQKFCKTECVKQGHPRRCPWYSKEGQRYWSIESLNRWTTAHCPQRRRLLPLLRGII